MPRTRKLKVWRSGRRSSVVRLSVHHKLKRKVAPKMELTGGIGRVRFVESHHRSKSGRTHVNVFALKRLYFGTFASRREKIHEYRRGFEAVRQVPGLKQHVPPTTRFFTGKKGVSAPGMFLTDLTEKGKYVIISGDVFRYAFLRRNSFARDFSRSKIVRILKKIQNLRKLGAEHGLKLGWDTFLVQFDAKTKRVGRIWICDMDEVVPPRRRSRE